MNVITPHPTPPLHASYMNVITPHPTPPLHASYMNVFTPHPTPPHPLPPSGNPRPQGYIYICIYIHTQISHVFLCSLIHFDWVHRGFNLGLALPLVYEWNWILLTVPCNPMQWCVKIIWVWIKIGHPQNFMSFAKRRPSSCGSLPWMWTQSQMVMAPKWVAKAQGTGNSVFNQYFWPRFWLSCRRSLSQGPKCWHFSIFLCAWLLSFLLFVRNNWVLHYSWCGHLPGEVRGQAQQRLRWL